MFFRTVYGPELPSMFHFIQKLGAVPESQVRDWFIQQPAIGAESANFDEALGFLKDTKMVTCDHENPAILVPSWVGDFHLGLLSRLQAECLSGAEPSHPLDPWFMKVLDSCFIRPNRLYVGDLHRKINQLPLPAPCSEEKVNAWKRVMEHIGCGRRIGTGFIASYRCGLIHAILQRWRNDGPLEEWLRFAETFLPVFSETGDMPVALGTTLLYLERRGAIRLEPRTDHAGRSYLGERRVKWLVMIE